MMTYDEISKAISVSDLTTEQLNDLKRNITRKLDSIEKEEKVKIYRLDIFGMATYYRTEEEVKSKLKEELEEMDAGDLAHADIDVDERYVPECDLGEYIGKLHV
ncbi:hypothetical protein [Vibrio sp. SCSIO 43136]|uniref:hypothetical protein n=1 Tax=Vibrio sp. SCSIO 43136 TaxID=2819101 RepID=UPI0020758B17|nr:hypothetical protein [Vibrio sp. SCSIO 43136]USD64193.1 hypothetical protein J4N39_08725 [Vibrio sp. SCSIO 43136]